MKSIDTVALILLIVGGLNWGLVGLFGFDLVAAAFGEMSALARVIYVLVGASALYEAFAVWSLPERWRGRGRGRAPGGPARG